MGKIEDNLMGPKQLAYTVRELRKKNRMTQRELAVIMVKGGHFEILSQEMIRRAEDSLITTGSKLLELRVAIIEVLEGVRIEGPFWIRVD